MLYSVNFNEEQLSEKDQENSPYYLKGVKKLSLDKLISLMKEKDIVKIVSCYYGIDALNKMLRELKGNSRSTDIILCAIGLSREGWIKQIEDLLDKKDGIHLGNYQNVYLYTKYSLLHSKIYFSKSARFKGCARGAVCLIGSANLSSNAFECNEEVLAEITDDCTKNSIESYIDSIMDDGKYLYSLRDLINQKNRDGNSFDLKEIIGAPDKSKTLMQYISSGYLFFKCSRNFSLGFSDAEFREETKDVQIQNVEINQNFVKKSKSLDISAILGLAPEIDELQEEKNEKGESKKIIIRSNSVETCFGYWVPEERYKTVVSMISSSQEDDESAKEKKYNQIYNALESNESQLSEKAKENLVQAFKQAGLQENRFNYYEGKVLKHIKMKKHYYEANKKIYLNNCFCITPMPNIFEDPLATAEFTDSLWGDVCERCGYHGVEKKQDMDVLPRKIFSLFVDNDSKRTKMKSLSANVNDLPKFKTNVE